MLSQCRDLPELGLLRWSGTLGAILYQNAIKYQKPINPFGNAGPKTKKAHVTYSSSQ